MSTGPQLLSLSHVAERSRYYPGEDVIFSTQVQVCQPLAGYVLEVVVPQGVHVKAMQPLATVVRTGDSKELRQGIVVQWRVEGALLPTARHDYQIVGQLEPFDQLRRYQQTSRLADQELWVHDRPAGERESSVLTLLSVATVQSTSQARASNDHDNSLSQKGIKPSVAPVTVYQQGDYMRHLPALYEQEGEFIGRFLMLFESFWAPVEQQIEHIYDYFDLKLTPLPFLRWLATWFDLDLPEEWAEARQRQLLAEIVQLYRLRGTRSGLQRYLELVTGGQVQITEYSAYQFRIGAKTRLGTGVAVGRKGRPHTFAVQLTLPHPAPDAGAETTAGSERLNEQTRLTVEQIIEAEKPAHTAYSLSITYAARG